MLKKRIDQLLYASCGVVSALALFSIMWLTLVDVVGRKFFNHSIPGGLEDHRDHAGVRDFLRSALGVVAWRACGV
jgi:hypothetical protein